MSSNRYPFAFGTSFSHCVFAGLLLAGSRATALDSQVTVDARQPLRSIDARVFGVNTAVWDPQFDTATTLSLLRESEMQALRFPGGSELKVQIVSATVDQTFWRWANRLDSKPQFVSTDQCAVWIADAVQSKLDIPQTDRPTMILALDARHAAYLADESVVRAAADLIQGVETLGFRQMWVVGPIAARCIALYPWAGVSLETRESRGYTTSTVSHAPRGNEHGC